MGFPWGLDLGSQNCVVAIARKGGIDVIDNEASSRKTPCMVGLGGKERGLGEAAKSKITSNIRNTVADVKTLIGRRWAEESVQKLAKTLPWTLKEGPTGGILVSLNYEKEGEECVPTDYTPEQILAMLLVNLKHTAESHNKSPSPDCVISVPCYFNDSQRRSVLDAAEIAGIKCLRLMNDTTAIALNWGLPKSMDFPDEAPKHVLFYDMGYSATQCCIVAFTKTKMTVLASAFDRELGGRHFDTCMLDYFAEQWKAKTKLDLKSNPKAVFRLEVQVDKIKQQLSGYSSNTKLPCNVECLQDDQDFHSSIELDAWLEMTKPLVDRCLEPVKQVFAATKLMFDQVEEVEVVGSATRSPLIVNALKDFLGKEPKRTMNSEEAVSKGCALNAAMLSPTFRVRDFGIVDCTPYSVALGWTPGAGAEAMDTDGKDSTVFTQYNVVPSVKMLTFMRTQGFDISASYAEPHQLEKGMPTEIGHWAVTGVGPMPDGSPSKVKVKVRIDANGIFSVDTAQLVEEVEPMEVEGEAAKKDAAPKSDDAAMPDAQPEGDAAATDPAAEPAGGAEPAAAAAAGDAEAKEGEKKKKKVKKTDLPVLGCPANALVPDQIEKFKNVEYEMSVQDRMIKELHDRKNDLEAYIYSFRDRCSESGDLGMYIAPADREKFMPMLDEMENWLYEDEAETAQKSTFVSKLDSLKAYGGPCVERAKEADERPLAFAELDKQINLFTAFSMTTEAAYDHIEQEDRDKVKGFADEAKSWASGKQAEQGAKKAYEPLAVTSAEIKQKAQQLQWDCNPIRNKPKPAPKKEEAPKPEAGAEAAPEGTPEGTPEAAPGAEAPPAGEAPPAAENMDMGLD